jgi:hypothetical protein
MHAVPGEERLLREERLPQKSGASAPRKSPDPRGLQPLWSHLYLQRVLRNLCTRAFRRPNRPAPFLFVFRNNFPTRAPLRRFRSSMNTPSPLLSAAGDASRQRRGLLRKIFPPKLDPCGDGNSIHVGMGTESMWGRALLPVRRAQLGSCLYGFDFSWF